MLTHKHALISLAYAGGITFFAQQGGSDPYVYLSAIIGGELIDLIDHPLYHIFYRRKERHVVHARKLFFSKGARQAIGYLKRVEDERKFKGLMLHNLFALLIVASISLFSSLFFGLSTYFFIFIGAFL